MVETPSCPSQHCFTLRVSGVRNDTEKVLVSGHTAAILRGTAASAIEAARVDLQWFRAAYIYAEARSPKSRSWMKLKGLRTHGSNAVAVNPPKL